MKLLPSKFALQALVLSASILLGQSVASAQQTSTPAVAAPAAASAMPMLPLQQKATEFCNTIDAAFQAHDWQKVSSLMTDDSVHVNPLGWVISKQKFVNAMQEGRLKFAKTNAGPAYQCRDLQFMMIDDKSIEVVGTLEASGMRDGHVVEGEFTFSRLLAQQPDGSLKEKFSQVTPKRELHGRRGNQ